MAVKYIPDKTVLIAGGSGLIGKATYRALKQSGYQPIVLSRNKNLAERDDFIYWNPETEVIDDALPTKVRAIINLCGEGIASKKWTTLRKETLIQSRSVPARFLSKLLLSGQLSTTCYIGASAIGIYGDAKEAWCTEKTESQGEGFLRQCCLHWEEAHNDIPDGIRNVITRIGIVLSPEGGALDQYRPLLAMRMVPFFGGGRPFMSWIDVRDQAAFFVFAMENDHVRGIYNTVASTPVNSRHFAIAFLKASGKRGLLRRIPNFAVRWLMGEMGDVVLESQRVSNKKVLTDGFRFRHDNLQEVLQNR